MALSSALPPPGVTRHRALWSPDFPPAAQARPAITRATSTPGMCTVEATRASPPPFVHWKGYKPDSVIDSHLSMRPVPAALTPNCSGALTRAASCRLFGLAPDEVFRAADIAIGAVGSYPAFSPLPAPEADEAGGLFSVALSVDQTLHPAALACERHRALWSLDFPPPRRMSGQRLSALPKLI